MKDKDLKELSPKDIAVRMRQSMEKMLANLIEASQVKPDDLSPEQEEQLQRIIANAEALEEKLAQVADEIESKDNKK